MGNQPLSLVDLTDDPFDSAEMPRHKITLIICEQCGHVSNADFNDAIEQYDGAGCLMYNNGIGWKEHVEDVAREIEQLPAMDLIVEIGAGDCSFLNMLRTNAVKLAVDPCQAVERARELGINFVRDYFDADLHVPAGAKNTTVVMRHLLEHMAHPRDLIESIGRRAQMRDDITYILVEVPCAENAIRNTRIEDWTYEHPQHFTERSLRRLMGNCGVNTLLCEKRYGGEVLVFLGAFYRNAGRAECGMNISHINEMIGDFKTLPTLISKNAAMLRDMDDHTVAYWGAAGKSAMFLRRFCVEDDAIVVDSDPNKVGMYVPGTSVPIRAPGYLKYCPISTIVATTSWRAEDIRDEIKQRNITCDRLLKFERGRFVEVPLGN
jgi:hypothetical protein